MLQLNTDCFETACNRSASWLFPFPAHTNNTEVFFSNKFPILSLMLPLHQSFSSFTSLVTPSSLNLCKFGEKISLLSHSALLVLLTFLLEYACLEAKVYHNRRILRAIGISHNISVFYHKQEFIEYFFNYNSLLFFCKEILNFLLFYSFLDFINAQISQNPSTFIFTSVFSERIYILLLYFIPGFVAFCFILGFVLLGWFFFV